MVEDLSVTSFGMERPWWCCTQWRRLLLLQVSWSYPPSVHHSDYCWDCESSCICDPHQSQSQSVWAPARGSQGAYGGREQQSWLIDWALGQTRSCTARKRRQPRNCWISSFCRLMSSQQLRWTLPKTYCWSSRMYSLRGDMTLATLTERSTRYSLQTL